MQFGLTAKAKRPDGLKRGVLMKKLALLLSVFFTASLLSTSVVADQSPAAPGPRPGTVEAMQCLTRQGPVGCETVFQGGARKTAMPWVFQNLNRDFKRGRLVFSNYWGRASDSNFFDARILINQPTTEMDIFDVKFAHVEYSLYISPAEADGKIRALAILLYAPHDRLQLSGTP
jgi:hypothetical protein